MYRVGSEENSAYNARHLTYSAGTARQLTCMVLEILQKAQQEDWRHDQL